MSILSLGDLLLDVTVRFDPQSGEAEAGPDAVRIGPGGSAANFAVYVARLGMPVRFVSRVGRDWPGEMLARDLGDEGVAASIRVVDDEPTGRVLVMVDPDGNRRMYSYPGASSSIHVDDLDPDWFVGLHAFHLTGYSLLRGGPREAALTALQMARAGGSPLCSLDPNPGHLISDFGPEAFRAILAGLQFDIIFPNLEEGRLLSGEMSPDAIATSLLHLSSLVVLTLGVDGCLVASQDGHQHVPAAPVPSVVDATGAGDAFAAGFIVEYLKLKDTVDAVVAGNALAAKVVSRVGAR